MMQRFQKILMFCSLAFCIVCGGATVWMAQVLNDSSCYMMTALFALAAVWFAITIYKSFKSNK